MTPAEINERLTAWTANTPYMFRLAERLLKREMGLMQKAIDRSPPEAGRATAQR